MAVGNFKPTIWEGALLANFREVSIAHAMCTKPVDKQGEKVIFNKVGAGTIKDYEGVVEWDEITTTPVTLVFDEEKYWAVKLEDVDKVQLKGDVLMATVAEQAALLGETYDKSFFAKLTSEVISANKIGAVGNKVKVTKTSAYDYIVDLSTALSKQKVPKPGRFVTVNAEFLGLLAKDPRFTNNPEILANGIVVGQKIASMQVMCSESLPANVAVAHHLSAVGGDTQLTKTEAMRLENAFADGVRGLSKYGFKTLRDNAVAMLYWEVGTASDAPLYVKNIDGTETSPFFVKQVPVV